MSEPRLRFSGVFHNIRRQCKSLLPEELQLRNRRRIESSVEFRLFHCQDSKARRCPGPGGLFGPGDFSAISGVRAAKLPAVRRKADRAARCGERATSAASCGQSGGFGVRLFIAAFPHLRPVLACAKSTGEEGERNGESGDEWPHSNGLRKTDFRRELRPPFWRKVRGNSARAAKHAFLYIFTFQRTKCGPRRAPARRPRLAWPRRGPEKMGTGASPHGLSRGNHGCDTGPVPISSQPPSRASIQTCTIPYF